METGTGECETDVESIVDDEGDFVLRKGASDSEAVRQGKAEFRGG